MLCFGFLKDIQNVQCTNCVCVLFQAVKDVLHGVNNAVPGALSVSVVSMVILIGGKMLNKRFTNKLPVAIPWELILVRDAHTHTHTHSQ